MTRVQKQLEREQALTRRFRVFLVLPILFLAFSAVLHAQADPFVETAVARSGRLDRVISQPAVLVPYEMVTVHSRLTGYAGEVFVDIGDKVKKGQLMVELEIPGVAAKLRAAEALVGTADAEVAKARAGIQLKKAIFELIRDLYEKGGKTQFQLEEARAELKLAEVEEKLAAARKFEVEEGVVQIRVLAQYARITAPFDGTVVKRLVNRGVLVRGETGNPTSLFEVHRVDVLRCRVEIPERDVFLFLESYRAKTLGASIEIQALPGRVFDFSTDELQGGVLRFSGALHQDSHHMIAEILLPNPTGELLSGLFGKARLRASGVAKGKVILVPNTAIQAPRKEKDKFVWLVKTAQNGTTVERRVVSLGATDGTLFEVLGGLEAGESVVVRGAGALVNGQVVRTSEE